MNIGDCFSMLVNSKIVRINCNMRFKLCFRACQFPGQAARLQPCLVSVYMAGLMNEYACCKNQVLVPGIITWPRIVIIQIEYLGVIIDIRVFVTIGLYDFVESANCVLVPSRGRALQQKKRFMDLRAKASSPLN